MKNRSVQIHSIPQPFLRRVCALILALSTAFTPVLSSAALFPGLIGRTVLPFVPPAGTLPQGFNAPFGGATKSEDGTTLTVTQNQGKDKVIIDWSKFNIGSSALVRFYQGTGTPGTADWKPNSNYAALNRIYDLSPSVINGSLQADGRVYLINRNGVFFGPDAKVQVQSLVASAFNISDANFNSGRLIFKDDHYDPNPDQPLNVSDSTTISNEGTITTHSGGSVFFVGPRVQNLGHISAPAGKIDLVGLKANGEVEIKEIMETRNSPLDVVFTDPALAGDVANMAGGSLHGEDGGWIGLYGKTARNDGLIRAVTTRRQNGVIYLSAKDLVATGQGSVTDVEVSDSPEAMGRIAQIFTPGLINFTGLYKKGVSETAAPKAEALARIDHEGSITAHSGEVRMEAVERVFLGGKSTIDVSGLFIERPVADQFIEAQLNGLYLRDDYGQKYGSLLPGSTVTIDVLKGSTIGNLSTYYLGMSKNARDLSTVGGSVTIAAPEIRLPGSLTQNYTLAETIISRGASINISGGAVNYSGSAPTSTKVIASDGRVYDISSAPQWLTYRSILGTAIKDYGKFGSEKISGISFGGHLLSMKSKPADRIVGGNAGSLTIKSYVDGLVDGLNLRAQVTTGINQTFSTAYLDDDKNKALTDSSKYQRYLDKIISENRGVEAPLGARFTLGNKLSSDLSSEVSVPQNAAVDSIVVKKSSNSVAVVTAWDDESVSGAQAVTEISADLLNRAGLSSLSLNANASITTEKEAEILLRPGGSSWITTGKTDKDGKEILRTDGSYAATARRIEFLGSVSAPGGSVEMKTRPNITSFAQIEGVNNPLYNKDIRETIYLGSDSRISTAGERIDNSLFGLAPLAVQKGGFINGGYISLLQISEAGVSGALLSQNNENSVVISQGALLDVSGGYRIDEKGVASGGNAGTLTVKAPTISLGGELRGFALPGKDGGEVILHAQEVQVVQGQGKQLAAGFGINDQFTDGFLAGKLVLAADRFQNSGFSRFNLSATDDVTVDSGVVLTPSLLKSDLRSTAGSAGATCSAGTCFSTTYPTFLDQIGKSSISLTAGKNVYGSGFYNSKLVVEQDNSAANLIISAGATVAAAAGGTITLSAPRIDIAGIVTTPGGTVTATATKLDLIVRDSGRIQANGYNKVGIVTKVNQPAPLPEPKAGGNVSLVSSNGKLNLEAGSLVDVTGSERVEGSVRGKNGALTTVAVAGDSGSLMLSYGTDMQLDGTIAGSGKMAGTRGGNLTIKNTTSDLTITAADVERYQGSGFDALTFSSPERILIPKNLSVSVGRSLTLDSQIIQGTGIAGDGATLHAPWIKLVNSGVLALSPLGTSIDTTSGTISFNGGYLDVTGSMQLKGFSQVSLLADRDLTFTDSYNSTLKKWQGELGTTAANLTLQASRIYPTTASSFTISTPGKSTILPGVKNLNPIYSAGGSLKIAANGGIYHNGFLAAPLGSILLDGGSGRVEATADSVITTAGSAPVAYGTYDGSKWWAKYDASTRTGTEEVLAAPVKSITLTGSEVVVRDGAVQDLSGGGSVYASYWQSGIPGTNNPLTVTGRYVILPDGSAERPGASVYLEAMPSLGLKAGIYSILPIEFAFVPGALVIQDTGKQLLAGQQAVSKERYPVVGGYLTDRDTAVASQVYKGFSVRRAEDVRREGDFTVKSIVGGDGGNFAFKATGNAAYFGGTIKMDPLAGYKMADVSFVAPNIDVVDKVDSTLPLSQTLQLDGRKLSALPIGELMLGDTAGTNEVTVQKLSNETGLSAASVTLLAKDAVTLKDGAQVNAENGYASIVTPDGTFTLGDRAQLTAHNGGVKLDVNNTVLSSTGIIDAGLNGTFSVTANGIKFDDASALDGYFHMTSALEKLFSQYKSFTIASRGDMLFLRDVDLTTGSLTIDAARYVGATTANFTARDITLLNSGKSYDTANNPLSRTGGSLSFTADNITVAPRSDAVKVNNVTEKRGNIVFDQFGTVNISSANDLVLKGEGTMAAGGDLNLSAARVTTSRDSYKADGSATVANITVDGRNGAVTLNGNTGTKGTSSTPGGSLQILGNTINQTGGLLDVAAGQIGLAATGDITINGSLTAAGSEQTVAQSGEKVYYSGGRITVQSDGGKVDLQSGASLDVSAVAQGDAGSIVLSAKTTGTSGVAKHATAQLAATAVSGKGGSFSIDSTTLAGVQGLDGLSTTLKDGGFNNLVNIRSRGGDLALSTGKTLGGREVVVAADNGSITIGGTINADTTDGSGLIELYSGTSLNLQSGSSLTAQGTDGGAKGGNVILSSQDGSDTSKTFNGVYALNVDSGSVINVAGNGGTGGTVAFRAYQNAAQNDVNMAAVGGIVTGASKVSVEAVKAEKFTTDTTVTQANVDTYTTAATTFMNSNGGAIQNRLFGPTSDPVNHLQSGIEISTAAGKNLTIGTVADTAVLNLSAVRPGGEAVVLTLKSGNNLTINKKISDAPTAIGTLHSSTMTQNSTGINLVAGSDGGANYMGVAKGSALSGLAGTGDLSIASGKWVYTENAPIRFAAGNDAIFKGTASGPNTMINADMKYNLGSYAGSVRGDVGRDLKLEAVGSAIQTAVGTIDIRTGRDLKLGSIANTGAIRTTGEFDNSALTAKQPGLAVDTVANSKSYWTYHNGGNISLNVGKAVDGNLENANGWDGAYVDGSLYDASGVPKLVSKNNPWFYLAAGFGGSRESGVSTSIPVTVGIATMGGGNISVHSGGTFKTQVGAFGRADKDTLIVSSGADMSSRLRVMNGNAIVTSGGSFGTADKPVVAELADAQVRIAALGDVRLGAVQNPDNSRDRIYYNASGPGSFKPWNMTYTQNTGFSATSLSGNVTLDGTNPYAGYASNSGYLLTRRYILPASFALSAGGDVVVEKKFVLAPSEKGNLELFAGGSIRGALDSNGSLAAGFKMQDVNIASMYGRQEEDTSGYLHYNQLTGVIHSGINHLGDAGSVKIRSGKDIADLELYLSKPAELAAGGNISGLKFVGQNITPASLTSITAGGTIDQGITADGGIKPAIEIGGPGTLLVQAAGNILLGNSGGITSVGNAYNGSFTGTGTETDSDLIVSAGAYDSASMAKQDVKQFFAAIRFASDEISRLKADGNTTEADRLLAETGKSIRNYFYTYTDAEAGRGNLDMVDSTISSRMGAIYAMAGSDMNIGKTALSNGPLKASGITTLYGGELSMYAGNDINVNESRLMTYMGGDITIWSDQGDINAGRGSKTVVSAPTPIYNYDPANPNVLASISFTPPAAGSGIRALTFDPDGEKGPIVPPAAGDIHIYAKGTLDAGEAGIQGGKLFLAASAVLNSQNIGFSAGSVGVPSSNQNTVSIGPMTGATDMTSDKKMIETISGGGEAAKKTILAEAEDFLMKYLDVKVVDLAEGTL